MKHRRAILVVAFLLANSSSVNAHALLCECTNKDGQVHIEAFFDDNTPARGAIVKILDASRKEIASGMTDEKGFWSHKEPGQGTYQVIVEAGQGHRAEVSFLVRPQIEPVSSAVSEKQFAGEISSREEMTQFPMVRLAIGLVVIGLLASGVKWLWRRTNEAGNDHNVA